MQAFIFFVIASFYCYVFILLTFVQKSQRRQYPFWGRYNYIYCFHAEENDANVYFQKIYQK